jgi:hypothetical protein
MRKFLSSLAYAGLILSSCIISAKTYADGKTKDNDFFVGSLITTPIFLSDNTAFSLLVEGGSKSTRVNGTLGFIEDCNRFKVSAEYLSQKLHYKFERGKIRHWMHQFALGGKYQHLFECPSIFTGLELGIMYSNAPDKSLSPVLFDITEGADNVDNAQLGGTLQDLRPLQQIGTPEEQGTQYRKIAGANSWLVQAGFLMNPWCCATLIPSITYQQVHYSRHFEPSKRLSGVGFIIDFNQRLYCNIDFDLRYQYQRAYNDLRVALNWNKIYRCGALGLGVFVDHVDGKCGLPSSTTTGIELSFAFGVSGCNFEKVSLLPSCETESCFSCSAEDLLAWISDPAVYMPEVLAIVDQRSCIPPSDNLPDDIPVDSGFSQIALNDYFTDENTEEIHYDVTFVDNTNGPESAVFNEETGVILLNLPVDFDDFTVDITANNSCGSDITSFSVVGPP